MSRSFVLASVFGVAMLAVAASACTADDCWSVNSFAPFLLGSTDAEAHRTCESIEAREASKPQAVTGGGVCAPRADDDPCVRCARAHCCEVVDACNDDEACACLGACRTEGCTSEQTNACGVSGVFGPTEMCLAEHCPKDCPAWRP